MIAIIIAAALAPCPLCTPDGRMAILAKAHAKSFDELEAPGRSLVRVMASDPAGAPPVITFVREADGSARVEAAGGKTTEATISAATFAEARRLADGVQPGKTGQACGSRDYSVQRREGLGAMTAVDSQGCAGEARRTAERLAALALQSLPACQGRSGEDPFDRLSACLQR